MLLAIDIGNSNVVFGLFDKEKLCITWRIVTPAHTTKDQLKLTLAGLFQLSHFQINQVHGSIISSVVPNMNEPFVAVCEELFASPPLMVGPGVKTGISILYENPREVGADRIVNAVAAYHDYQQTVIVVDFGTATTFDVVSDKGEYLGGIITPGIGISMEALFSRTAKLPRIEFAKPQKVIGKTTNHSIQSGMYFGYVGMVDALVNDIKTEIQKPHAPVIATGGWAESISKDSKTIQKVDNHLTLFGLWLIYEKNSGSHESSR